MGGQRGEQAGGLAGSGSTVAAAAVRAAHGNCAVPAAGLHVNFVRCV